MTRPFIPDQVLAAAHARAAARAARDWAEADRLRAEIEAAGWRVTDRGTDFALEPAVAPDLVDAGGVVRYGSSGAVPSRLAEAPVGTATVVLVAGEWPTDLGRALAGLEAHAPDGTSVVVVGEGPSSGAGGADGAGGGARLGVEVVQLAPGLGHAASLDAGIRRASGPVVILLDTSVEPVGDIVTPLVRALDDPSVAVAGGWGIVSGDLRTFRDAPAGDVDAIEGYALAFRRADYVERGPLDAHFRFYRNLDIWWSLVLRDGHVAGAAAGGPNRRAVAVADLPAVRHEHRGWTSLPDDERDRQSRRNFYRVLDRFRGRSDLLSG